MRSIKKVLSFYGLLVLDFINTRRVFIRKVIVMLSVMKNNRKYQNNISSLTQKVKLLKVSRKIDLIKVVELRNQIFKKWMMLKERYKKKKSGSKKNKCMVLANYDAEEEMVIGLMFLISEKLINALQQIK